MNGLRAKGLHHSSFWIGAFIVGTAAVLYAKAISSAQEVYLHLFEGHSYVISILSPFGFLVATFLVRRFAPDAKGSGIPQVLEAIDIAKNSKNPKDAGYSKLVSVKTAVIKVFSSVVGILSGASIGREGPTVQVASSGFAWVGRKFGRLVPRVDFQAYLIAGAAAGVAAAFNTPLAGITFALEELADGAFGPFRENVMLAVIVAGISAQALLGNYLYFGHPIVSKPDFMIVPQAMAIGIVGGIFGGVFSKLLGFPQLVRLPSRWWIRAFVCGSLCSLIGLLTHADTAGSGYEVTRKVLEAAETNNIDLLFPLYKIATTILSYLSGMAGGIFSPTLSIGAGLGISIAKIAHLQNFKICALMGMVAFFTGVVQAPLTAVIIVMEMTDEHILILPFMVAAFLAQGIGKWIMPVPLYRLLANRREEA